MTTLCILLAAVAVIARARVAVLPGWVVPVPALILAAELIACAASVAWLIHQARHPVPRTCRGGPGMTRMSRQDRDLWASARTLADLGELTARWIGGDLAAQPGYRGPSDIEDPALIPLLARMNRAGFVTTGSQPGFAGTGYDGARWEQRAAVEGFISDPRLLGALAHGAAAGLFLIMHDPASLPRWRYRRHKALTVTSRYGEEYTRFGVQLLRRHIRDDWLGYGLCHPDVVRALCAAWQVTVIDPEWGRPDLLWPVLAGAVTPPGGPS